MKVGIVSDSPTLTTGIGIVTDRICRAVMDAGHQVTVFGFKDVSGNPKILDYPYPIWPIDPFEKWGGLLRTFAMQDGLDVLFVYSDVYNLEEVMTCLAGLPLPPMSLLAIFDGIPVYPRLLESLRLFRTVVVTTQAAADYLSANGIFVHAVAPPGVDTGVFHPLDALSLRCQIGLQDTFLIGVFGRNTERKQQPRVLMALRRLLEENDAANVLVYFHCAPRAYWDLAALARRWRLSERVVFAEGLKDEIRGVPLRGDARGIGNGGMSSLAAFGYVELLNICDLVVNVPHSGDFEQVLLEAPACGVPVIGTDDQGGMRTALGPGVPAPATPATLGNAGQPLYYADPASLASIIKVIYNDSDERDRLREAGLEHARRHPWSILSRCVVAAIEQSAQPSA